MEVYWDSMEIFDSHTHLNDEAFWGAEQSYIKHAKKLGVTTMAQVGSNTILNQRAIQLAEKYPNTYAVIGWHPEDSKDFHDNEREQLLNDLKNEKVVAIGEIGLDYHWDTSPQKVQRRVFEEQLEIANTLKMPVAIHNRDAMEDTYDILKSSNIKEFGGVMHSFNGSVEWLEKFLALGMNISYSGVASFKKTKELHESVRQTPLDRIMVETDAPYLAPEPLRGQQNEPAYALYVLEALARHRDMNPVDLADATYQNACRLYRIKNEKN